MGVSQRWRRRWGGESETATCRSLPLQSTHKAAQLAAEVQKHVESPQHHQAATGRARGSAIGRSTRSVKGSC